MVNLIFDIKWTRLILSCYIKLINRVKWSCKIFPLYDPHILWHMRPRNSQGSDAAGFNLNPKPGCWLMPVMDLTTRKQRREKTTKQETKWRGNPSCLGNKMQGRSSRDLISSVVEISSGESKSKRYKGRRGTRTRFPWDSQISLFSHLSTYEIITRVPPLYNVVATFKQSRRSTPHPLASSLPSIFAHFYVYLCWVYCECIRDFFKDVGWNYAEMGNSTRKHYLNTGHNRDGGKNLPPF